MTDDIFNPTKVFEDVALYLEHTLGLRINPTPWNQSRLPHFLKETYAFSATKILNVEALLMLDMGLGEQTPAVIRKHIQRVQSTWEGDIIYVCPSITAYNRKRLIEQKVPFIVPGNQMYLPMEGIDFREYFKSPPQAPEAFSPSAHVLLLHVLINPGGEAITPREAATRLGYSAMTMTRAFKELEATHLIHVKQRGKERHLHLRAKPQEVWQLAQPWLSTPVKSRFFIQSISQADVGLRAGLSALAEWTMLAPPKQPAFALSRKAWSELKQNHDLIDVPSLDPVAIEVQLWNYPPEILSKNNLVDPLSLFLSLRDSEDERVMASLEALMETVRW